jgi:voltage-gated potassium channel
MEFTLTFLKSFCIGLGYTSPILIFLLLTICTVGLSIGRREKWKVVDAIYFAFITATTVGYGDFHPSVTSSKYKAVFITLVGVLLTGIIVAIGINSVQVAFIQVHELPGGAIRGL